METSRTTLGVKRVRSALRAGRQQRPAPIQLSPPSASFLASHIKDPRATAAWREQARANVEVRVSAGERPLNALHAEYAARAESFGIDRQRVQMADGRRLLYSLHPDIDDSKLRGVIFFHTGTIKRPDGCGLPGHVDDKLVFGDGPLPPISTSPSWSRPTACHMDHR
jgi:hypothetical protein